MLADQVGAYRVVTATFIVPAIPSAWLSGWVGCHHPFALNLPPSFASKWSGSTERIFRTNRQVTKWPVGSLARVR